MATTHAPSRLVPLNELMFDFLGYLELERGLSRNTLEAYRSDLQQYGEFLARSGLDPLEITLPAARRFCVRTRRRARRSGAGGRRDTAAQSRLLALLLSPPTPRAVARPRPDHRAAQPAGQRSAAESAPPRRGHQPAQRAARKLAGALRDRALLETMYPCGLRASEATDLQALRRRPRGGHPRARGKGSKERIVPIGRRPSALWRPTWPTAAPRWSAYATSRAVLNLRGGRL